MRTCAAKVPLLSECRISHSSQSTYFDAVALGLTGRPDRLVKADGTIIPEEWKSSRRVWPSHRAQMGTYFLLIEEELRIRPTHGFIVLGDGTRHRIENTSELRAYVLELSCRVPSA